MTDTTDQVIKIVADQLGVDITKVCRETTMQELYADELDVMELVMDVEDAFHLEETDIGPEDITTVADLAALTRRRKRAV